ncbi:hypothetical protein FNV43_RR20333 [Rhamnella rubrinervis]|uniref:Uncharacterized protein n=1 Tax=Rhamnella rubrinervis TaxID=2594499 RepID=A0A8K0GQD0_9ROSA|nr:hypothetical protein FNV43_RR20333 [Rhamnella rubrinervis]
MADISVPIVLDNLIKFGTYEANLLRGVRDQVDTLESDLRFIKVFLKKSAGTRNDPFVEELVNQIRDAALEIEDVIDAYAARVIKERRRNLVGKLFHFFGHARVLHGVANKTTRIMDKVENIYNNKEKYGIGEADQPSVDDEEAEQSSIERRRRNVEEADVVGFEKDTKTLIDQLTNQRNLQRDVITIHGMGGLGKTTLARKIYKETRVVKHFACRAWVVVSQRWQARTLLLDVLKSFKQISEETSKKVFEELKDELYEHLKGKTYLIVLDDIWSTQVWEELRVAFPDESNGSRILITTRERDVARHASPSPPHDLKLLDEDESWELLRKKVFRGRECPSDLTELGKKIAERDKLSNTELQQLALKIETVLSIRWLEIRKIPSQIEELIFLRCLFIKDCGVEYVSSSIWNFRYLETLHLDFYGGESLPKGIWSVMKNLRYLYLASWTDLDLRNIPRRSLVGEPFWNLQVLSWLSVNKNTALVIAKFPNLRKLGLSIGDEFMEEGEVEKVMASIGRLESLQSIKIREWSANPMEVGRRLNSLPSTLIKISWERDEIYDWDTFKVLARQPHLRVLKITSMGDPLLSPQQPHEVSAVAGEFPQLQVLKLRNLRVKTLEMEKDAMPNLESLFIDSCPFLEYLPEDEDELLRRSNLQLVEFSNSEARLVLLKIVHRAYRLFILCNLIQFFV